MIAETLLMLALSLPPQAEQPADPPAQTESQGPLSKADERFISAVVLYSRNNKAEEAARLILDQPEVAERTFQVLLTALVDLPADQQRLATAYLNTVARVMESQRKTTMVDTLRAYRLLIEP